MYTRQDLTTALKIAKIAANKRGGNFLLTEDLTRSQREILLHFNWLQPLIKGWYMFVNPKLSSGESTYWYVNFWKFVVEYL